MKIIGHMRLPDLMQSLMFLIRVLHSNLRGIKCGGKREFMRVCTNLMQSGTLSAQVDTCDVKKEVKKSK